MANNKAAIMYLDKGPAISMVEAAITEEGSSVWHELIYTGNFTHPKYGKFSVTPEVLATMVEEFNSGRPVSAGIPIDERADHSVRPDGAYGWIKQLEVRDEALWGEIKWTSDGVEAVDSGRLPYISPRFTVGADNFVKAAALCTRPFFLSNPNFK